MRAGVIGEANIEDREIMFSLVNDVLLSSLSFNPAPPLGGFIKFVKILRFLFHTFLMIHLIFF